MSLSGKVAHELNDADERILDELRGGRNLPQNLATELDYSRQYVQNRLQMLKAADYVENVGGGLYELLDDPRDNYDVISFPELESDLHVSGIIPVEIKEISTPGGKEITVKRVMSGPDETKNWFHREGRALVDKLVEDTEPALLRFSHADREDERVVIQEIEWEEVRDGFEVADLRLSKSRNTVNVEEVRDAVREAREAYEDVDGNGVDEALARLEELVDLRE